MIKKSNVWQLQNAKSKFSEVVNRALNEGPQLVTRKGKPVVYVVSENEYNRIKKKKKSLIELLLNSPCKDVELDVSRSKQGLREVEF